MLQDDQGDALATVQWWLESSTFNQGMASGPPEWPLEGGYLAQPAKLVEAVKVLRNEWTFVIEAPRGRSKEPVREAPPRAKGRVRRGV